MTQEEIIAYVDGELGPIEAARFERAIEADPAIAAEVARHRNLRNAISGHFALAADEPLPAKLTGLLDRGANVLSFPKTFSKSRWSGQSGRYAALAATLVAGLVAGQLLPRASGTGSGPDGAVMAQGDLATALDTQLASAQRGGIYRIGSSFRSTDNRYCRTFAGARGAGIGCHGARGWTLEHFIAGTPASGVGAYAQAANPMAEIAAAAQNLMAGAPLDAAQERKARAQGWSAKP